jgi:hypothetical protein
MLTVDPPPAGAPVPDAGGNQAKAGFMATVRTMAVTAAVVAASRLLGGYIVHEVTRHDHLTPPPATSVSTSNPASDPNRGANPDFRFRGRRGDGQFPDPSNGPPPGRFGAPDDTTPTTGRA